MDIKVNRTYLIEIGDTKVNLSRYEMIKLRDILTAALGETENQNTIAVGYPIKQEYSFPVNPWYPPSPQFTK